MDNYIITISRRFASRGHEIAAQMSRTLGIPVYDRSAVEARVQSLQDMTEDSQIREKQVESETGRPKEKTRSENGGKSLLMGLFRREMREEIRDEAQIEFERQSLVIRSLVQEGPCIILGRCADQIFEDYPRALHIFIYASDEKRIQNTMDRLHTGEDEARALVKNEDRAREAYRRRFSSHPDDEVVGRHILIDSGKLGVELSSRILCEAAKHLFCEKDAGAETGEDDEAKAGANAGAEAGEDDEAKAGANTGAGAGEDDEAKAGANTGAGAKEDDKAPARENTDARVSGDAGAQAGGNANENG